jgi:hypothetical protein
LRVFGKDGAVDGKCFLDVVGIFETLPEGALKAVKFLVAKVWSVRIWALGELAWES